MFTGIVEEKGTLRSRTARGPGARVDVATSLGPLVLGESISVDGCCLTVASIVAGGFEADCSHETLARTTLGAVAIGGGVNLERAVPLGGRMGGHIVSGHVDGTGVVLATKPDGEALHVDFAMPGDLARYVAAKGSICINGVSLTVNAVAEGRFSVMLIPHTLHETTLASLAVGQKVNLEVDMLARYVARLMQVASESPDAKDAALLEKLRNAGLA